ncbi:uncharacterized protein V1513DRAFT_439712 [Lipomyces chichibuensis]|uniref:uncharacterized protein n=1 Tax=Lipomyces chichibuensis TaxID=1546026 RepID=UPI0033439630
MDTSESLYAPPALQQTTLLDLLSNVLVLRALTPYLSIYSLIAVATTCRTLHTTFLRHHGAVHELDLSLCSSSTVNKVLSLDVIRSSLRTLYLDSCFVDDMLLTSLFADYKLRHLSLSSSYGWTLEHLCELVQKFCLAPMPVCSVPLLVEHAQSVPLSVVATGSSSTESSPSPTGTLCSSPATDYGYICDDDVTCCARLSIKSLGLLGGPTFPTSSLSTTAPIFANIARRAGIITDLTPCEAHPPSTSTSSSEYVMTQGWFLAEHNPRECHSCRRAEEKLCLHCLVLRSCRGCLKFWCSKCDPSVMKTKLDCYECGPTCESCKFGIISFCNFCKAKYCRIHQEGSTEKYCDWCSSRGGRYRFSF